jgi:hypothetical protein
MAVVYRTAGDSSKGFTIRHEQDTVDQEIPVYPTKVTPSNNIISRSWNDFNGGFHDILINRKLKISWVFDVAAESKARDFLENTLYAKIEQYGSRRFVINSNILGVGWILSTFYLGTPDNIDSLGGYFGKGNVDVVKFELHWIETEGKRYINS